MRKNLLGSDKGIILIPARSSCGDIRVRNTILSVPWNSKLWSPLDSSGDFEESLIRGVSARDIGDLLNLERKIWFWFWLLVASAPVVVVAGADIEL